MANVRLSNGSPTLERTDARVADPGPPKPTLCRNLFGPVDHDALRRDLRDHLRDIDAAAAARWNFDFARDAPLGGRFDWQPADAADVPAFFHPQWQQPRQRQQRRRGTSPPPPLMEVPVVPETADAAGGNNNVDVNGNHRCVVVVGGGAPSPAAAADGERRETDCGEQCHGQRKRPACHDTATQTKRSHTSSPDEVRCQNLTHAAEHTPRKSSPRRQT